MYSIPNDFDIKQIIGQAIVQVCYSINTISIHFERTGFITIEGSFTYFNGNKNIVIDELFPLRNDHGLLNLLETKVVDVSIDTNRTMLTICFAENHSLMLIGIPEFESYIICFDGIEIRV